MKPIILLFSLLLSIPAISQQGYSINNLGDSIQNQFFDQTITSFMEKYDIPGLSIAMARKGKIIFAKGYGYADKDRGRLLGIADQFRIASISKPITAVVILKLVEDGKLSLDDKVFGTNGILKITYPTMNRHVDSITIRHLLEHSAATEWENDSNDPMFSSPNLGKQALVQKILKKRILADPPGSHYAYSNFGYCILGLVIEKISGINYEHYVKQTMFAHLNAKSFSIADNIPSNTFPEVHYYDDEYDPYWFPIKRMDSHGGWKANAIDLVLFSLSVDGMAIPEDLLTPASIDTMSTPSINNDHYALGWNINQYKNRWHMSSLPGTASILVRTEHGYSWAILMNKSSSQASFMGDLDSLPWDLVNHLNKN